MKLLITVVAALTLLVLTATAPFGAAEPQVVPDKPARVQKPQKQTVRHVALHRVRDSLPTKLKKKIHTARRSLWNCQAEFGTERTHTVRREWAPHSMAFGFYLRDSIAERAEDCVKELKLFRSQFVLKDSRTWLLAVDRAQIPYPGTKAWLLSCSGTEGSWYGWVRIGGGSYYSGYTGIGGWMQAYLDTFDRFWNRGWYDPARGRSYIGARDDLLARGYKLPPSLVGVSTTTAWRTPDGQALASAHAYLNGRRGEWHSSGCYIN